MVAPDEVMPEFLTSEMTGRVTPELSTATFTDSAVPMFPTTSRATAESACGPFEAAPVFQVLEYGLVTSSSPRLAPSNLNCTPATPMLSEAFADTATVPESVAPAPGAVITAVGGSTS